MWPQSLYEVLSGQRLTSILAFEPWGNDLRPDHSVQPWALFGALALGFGQHTLLVGSPLRYLRSQDGTRFGLADGSSVSLGFRALLCDSEQAEALVSLRFGLPETDQWRGWLPQSMPSIDRALAAAPMLTKSADGQNVGLIFDFEGGARYRLEYRQDLDGAIEFSPEGTRSKPEFVEVLQAKGPFGWLHPARIAGFVLDDQRWRNMEHWPIEVRRRLRDADREGPEVIQLMQRAWLAYFRQYPDMGRRLLALSVPVRVVGLPEGFVESVRANLQSALADDATARLPSKESRELLDDG